ncbi:MAG: peptidoglycan bridge formation glycyltransferase FemA/FemB family protein [Anaerolineales bacterium]|nr:peptidoglycan bridge formation glycyltransferase FemA/FemB family protein [Anaerolineales bacterium]
MNAWNQIISALPNPHFLQTYEWAQVKAQYGWEPIYLVWTEKQFLVVNNQSDNSSLTDNCIAACLVLKRTILRNAFAARLSVLYAPKGPLLDWENESLRNRVLNDLQTFAKRQGAIFLKIDPDIVLGRGTDLGNSDLTIPSEMRRRGWVESREQIQFKNTVVVDLSESEESILMRMKQKTRYNVRLAEKKNIKLRAVNLEQLDLELRNLYKMYAETSVRDGFVIRDENYYMTVWKIFAQSPIANSQSPIAVPIIAEYNNEPIAALFLFMFARRAYYVYGMSRNAHREKMPTYLLQWEAMKIAKSHGCLTYDLWGAPNVFDESDSLRGVYRFKEGLGGEVARTLGAYDFAPNKITYALYSDIMPRLLNFMRLRGKEKTKQALGSA